MRRKLSAIVFSGVVIGGGFIVPSAASAHSGDGDHFTLAADITNVDREDNGKSGPSKGDVYSFEYDLSDHHGDDAGTGDSTCELIKADRDKHEFEADCEGTLDLDDGKLELSGTVTDEDFKDGKLVFDVVDGTDDFEDAEGTATFTSAGDHKDHHASHADHDDDRHDDGPDFKIKVDLD